MTDTRDEQPARPAMERAEELVDSVGRRVGPLRGFLGLALPTPFGLALVAAATLAAVLLSRGWTPTWAARPRPVLLPVPSMGSHA